MTAVLAPRPPPPAVARASASVAALRNRLPYADFFRALAIFAVFLAHAGGIARPPALHHVALVDLLTPFDGVAMLFCLSGFLLSGPLVCAFLTTPQRLPRLGPYLIARFLRIYPLYLSAVIGIALVLWIAGTPASWRDIATHLMMLQNFSPATIQTLSGPLWTMPLDVQFYLLLPLGFALAARIWRNHGERARIAALFALVAVVIALSIAYRFAVVLHWSPRSLDEQLFAVDQFPGMAALFALGIGARLVVLLLDRRARRLGGAALVALVIAAFACRWLQYGAHLAWLHLAASPQAWRPALFAAVDETIGGVGCAFLLVAADEARTSRFGRMVASPAVAYAAAISYGVYLLHYTVLTQLGARMHGAGTGALLLLIGVALVILVPLCSATYVGIERVFLARKARLARG